MVIRHAPVKRPLIVPAPTALRAFEALMASDVDFPATLASQRAQKVELSVAWFNPPQVPHTRAATARSTADGRGGYRVWDTFSAVAARRAPIGSPEAAKTPTKVELPLATAAAHAAVNIAFPTRGEATVET